MGQVGQGVTSGSMYDEAAVQECGKAEKVTGARLTRYAAALPLDLSHRRALVQSAIARNMDVANYE